jgi:hypothetical protein
MAVIANVALTNTFDTWRTRTNVGFTRLNAFTINESSLYANTLTSNVAFTAKGTATVTGLFTASGRATVGTNLNVSGNTTLGGSSKTLTIGGSGATVNATGWFGITGRASVSTNLHVAGNTSVMSRLGVGTAVPAFKVEVVGGTNDGIHIKDAASATVYGGIFTQSSNFYVAARSNHSLSLGTNDTDRLTIGATGLVTTVRSHAITQNLTVSGNTTLNGTTTDKSNALNQTLTDGATINWDTSLGRVATVTLGGARAMAAATNQKVGTYILRVVQDGTGGRTLTWNGNYKWTAQTAPVLSTAIGAVDIITFFSDGSKMYGSYLPDMR